jgi:predicted RNA-binding protein (virulence factor B family)
MKIKLGEYNTLQVLRETEFSYILNNEEEPIFLHHKQTTRALEIGEEIRVFIYLDNQKRMTATMNQPLVDQDHPAFLEVVDTNYRLGAFLYMGLIKDLLLSKDDLPFIKKEWPQKGDKIFAKLRVSKKQLTAKIIPRFDIANYLKPQTNLEVGKEYPAYNVYKTEEGNIFVTEEGHYIYVYFKHMRKQYRLGEKGIVKITIDKGNYSYNGTLIKQKELMQNKDAEYILQYLKQNGGVIPFSDQSDPTAIQETFNMSKSAFKRALGALYKQHLVQLEKDKTILIDIDN